MCVIIISKKWSGSHDSMWRRQLSRAGDFWEANVDVVGLAFAALDWNTPTVYLTFLNVYRNLLLFSLLRIGSAKFRLILDSRKTHLNVCKVFVTLSNFCFICCLMLQMFLRFVFVRFKLCSVSSSCRFKLSIRGRITLLMHRFTA